MRKIVLILAAIVFFLPSCKSGVGKKSEVPSALLSVPSDAVAVACFASCEECLAQMTDSSDALMSLPYGELASHPAAYSYIYGGSLVPMLSLSLGRTADTSLVVRELVSSLETCNFVGRVVAVKDEKVLVISRSTAVIEEVVDHIGAGTSIFSSTGFSDAYSGKDAIYARNSTIAPLLKMEFPSDKLTRKTVTSFLKTASDWIVLEKTGEKRFKLTPVCDDDPSYAANVFKNLPCAKMQFALADSSDFCIDLALDDWKTYRTLYESWLDTKNKLADVGKSEEWASGIRPLELVKFVKDDIEVLLVRCGVNTGNYNARPNDFQNCLSSLFGGVFSLEDESWCACRAGWLIIGAKDAIDGYLDLKKPETLPSRDASLYLRSASKGSLCIDKHGISIIVY